MTATLTASYPAAPLDDFDDAVAQVLIGRIVGASFGSVYGLVGNGLLPTLNDDIAAIKGRDRLGRPLSVCLPSAQLTELIDPDQLHPSIRTWVLTGHGLTRAFGSQCSFRVPIRSQVAASLPAHLISYADGVAYLQSLDPSGIPGGGELITALWWAGIDFPAVTSMNYSGVPEIIEPRAAARFARVAGLPSLISGPMSSRRGALTIVGVGPAGLSVVREGTFPSAVVTTVARHAGQPRSVAVESGSRA